MNKWTNGQMGKWTNGQIYKCTNGPMYKWTTKQRKSRIDISMTKLSCPLGGLGETQGCSIPVLSPHTVCKGATGPQYRVQSQRTFTLAQHCMLTN